MALDVDQVVERRTLRRKLTFWRILGVLAVVAALVAGAVVLGGDDVARSSPHVARLVIGGIIRNDRDRVELIDSIADSRAQAVILSINSPGGTVTGSEQLYDALRRLAEKKPVVAVVEGMAASGAYIAALGADHIVARRNALVGSIGVIFQFPNVYELLKTWGVSVEDIKSSPLKAAPNGYEPTSPEARAAIDSLVVDSYAWFKGLVAERRKLSGNQLAEVSDGRVFTGHQGLGLQLVDQIGDEDTAREWLAREKGVSRDLKVRTWRTKEIGDEFGWLSGAVRALGVAIGFPAAGELLAKAAGSLQMAQLDGLLALWHPEAER